MTDQEPSWDDLVPEVTLRAEQREALTRTWEALHVRDRRVVLLEAPTGIGKSIVQLALMRHQTELGGSCYMTTPQRALQDQMKGWAQLAIMKGKGSYRCGLIADLTAATAPCRISQTVRRDHPECSDDSCPFFKALITAKESSIVVHNYASLMAQSHIGHHFGVRDLLCLDEGHTAVSWIRNYMTIEVSPDDLEALTTDDPPDDLDEFMPWFRSVLSSIDRDMDTGRPIIPQGAPDQLRIELLKVFAHTKAYGVPSSSKLPSECGEDTALVPWATLWSEPDEWHRRGYWSMVPIRIRPMANTLLGLGHKVLVVTATVLNSALFRLELGVGKDEYEAVVIDSAFDRDSRPIRKRYAGGRMSFKHRDGTIPKMIDELCRIADAHSSEPGMIHTVSHWLSGKVHEAMSERLNRPVVRLPRGRERDDIIRRFLSGALGPAAILVGPSLMEGVDGKDGSCRWQAMCKVPWPHRKDPIVTHLLDSPRRPTREWGHKWYTWKTAQQTVQGLGRVCRSHTDFGVTYLMDPAFDRILKSRYVPNYILEAVS